MKRVFLLLSMFAAISLSATNQINLHLVGCTSDEDNPTQYDAENGAELYFTPNAGYTMVGADVSVLHGETEIPLNDWESKIGYVYFEASTNCLYFWWYGEVTDDSDDKENDVNTVACLNGKVRVVLQCLDVVLQHQHLYLGKDGTEQVRNG